MKNLTTISLRHFQGLALYLFFAVCAKDASAQIPDGFTPIFNGKNLAGWHISRTSHQGTTPNFFVKKGVMTVKQQPYGQGGVLLSDKKYKNFELYIEVKVDSFTNGGLFLRSSESGMAYQVELDETSGGTGKLLGERMQVSKPASPVNRQAVWKPNDWNAFRIRMTGEIPTIIVWINGVEMYTVTQPVNDFVAGAVEGMIGLQSHWTALYSPNAFEWNGLRSWAPGAKQSFRNIAVKEL